MKKGMQRLALTLGICGTAAAVFLPIPEASGTPACQSVRMVQVVDRTAGVAVNMDVHEASRPDATAAAAGVATGPACSRPGVLPWTNVTPAQAAAACQAAGKRLCTLKEWKAACQSVPRSFAFPYGGATIGDYKRGVCNDSGKSLVPTGSQAGCVTQARGLFDMSGNAGEWLFRASGGPYQAAGGTYAQGGLNLMCEVPVTLPMDFSGIGVGFRCCSGV